MMGELFTFGIKADEALLQRRGQPARWWGARAIYHPRAAQRLDIPFDRQSHELDKARVLDRLFIDWIDNTFMKELNVRVRNVPSSSNEMIEISNGRYLGLASPKESHGYMYIGAFDFGRQEWKHLFTATEFEATTDMEEDRPVYIAKNGHQSVRGKWSGKSEVPALGTTVKLNYSSMGEAIIVGYYVDHGWFGCEAVPLNPPQWWIDQRTSPGENATPFGLDIEIAP